MIQRRDFRRDRRVRDASQNFAFEDHVPKVLAWFDSRAILKETGEPVSKPAVSN